MIRRTILFAVGIAVLALPYAALPEGLERAVTFLLGALIILLAFLIPKRTRRTAVLVEPITPAASEETI